MSRFHEHSSTCTSSILVAIGWLKRPRPHAIFKSDLPENCGFWGMGIDYANKLFMSNSDSNSIVHMFEKISLGNSENIVQ